MSGFTQISSLLTRKHEKVSAIFLQQHSQCVLQTLQPFISWHCWSLNPPGRSPCSLSSRVHLLLEKFSGGPSQMHSSIPALDEYLLHISHQAASPPCSKGLMINGSSEQWQFHGSLGTTTLRFHPLDYQAITGQ